MLYGIGAVPRNQVRFGVTSTELNQNLNLAPENKTATAPSTAQPVVQQAAQPTENEAPKKKSHKFLKTVGVIAVIAAGVYALVKSGKLANIFNKNEIIEEAQKLPKRMSRRHEATDSFRKHKPEVRINKRNFRKGS
ncbi:MAG: hypothetical protein WCG23_06915 [bacterium]